jgi:flagellar M-ring protein FliF
VNSFLQTLKNLGMARLAAMGGVLVFLMGALFYLATHLGSTEMSVLFNELDPSDAKKIISQLDEQNIQYRLTKNGTEIMVPASDALKLRVQLAETVSSSMKLVKNTSLTKKSRLFDMNP